MVIDVPKEREKEDWTRKWDSDFRRCTWEWRKMEADAFPRLPPSSLTPEDLIIFQSLSLMNISPAFRLPDKPGSSLVPRVGYFLPRLELSGIGGSGWDGRT